MVIGVRVGFLPDWLKSRVSRESRLGDKAEHVGKRSAWGDEFLPDGGRTCPPRFPEGMLARKGDIRVERRAAGGAAAGSGAVGLALAPGAVGIAFESGAVGIALESGAVGIKEGKERK